MPFDANFALYPVARTNLPALLHLVDGYSVEEHKLTLGTTENPVESGSTLTDNAVKRRERLKLTGWVSDILAAPGNRVTHDRSATTWGVIVRLFEDRTPMDALTMIRTYRNMMIVQCVNTVDKTTGRGLRFTIDLAEMLFAETNIARFPPDIISGPAIGRSSEVDGGDRISIVLP